MAKANGFTLGFYCDNAAFADGDGRAEVARILRDVAQRIENGENPPHHIRDANGNTVGFAKLGTVRV